jgi:FHA domain-containing protein
MSETGGTAPTGPQPVPGWGTVVVHPGGGVVHRGPDVLLVVPAVTDRLAGVTAELLATCADVPDPTGRRRIRHVARLITDAEPEDLPAFAVVIEAGDHLTVLAHGNVTVTVAGEKQLSFSGSDSLAWVERSIPLPFDSVSVGSVPVGGASAEDDRPARVALDGLPLDLLAGTVPGSGVTVGRAPVSPTAERAAALSAQEVARVLERPAYLRSPGTGGAPAPQAPPAAPAAPEPPPAPAETAVPAAQPEPAEKADGRTVLRKTVQMKRVSLSRRGRNRTGTRRPPLPVGPEPASSLTAAHRQVVAIEGVLCPAGHLNEPGSSACGPCGAAIDADAPRVTQPRPPLGVLVTDEGAVYTVTTDYIVGREPEHAPDVTAGRARPLVLRDAENSTSRVHARLHLSGWEVLVADSGSANGTYVSRGGAAGPWDPVYREPGTRLHPGDRVRLGKRQLLFDRYHLPSSRLQALGKEGSSGPRR